jgi:hypothetical protein
MRYGVFACLLETSDCVRVVGEAESGEKRFTACYFKLKRMWMVIDIAMPAMGGDLEAMSRILGHTRRRAPDPVRRSEDNALSKRGPPGRARLGLISSKRGCARGELLLA